MEEDLRMKDNRKAYQPTSRKRKMKGIDSAGKRREEEWGWGERNRERKRKNDRSKGRIIIIFSNKERSKML